LKKASIIILILICCKHYGFTQQYSKDQTKLLYKYKIQKHTTTCDDYVDSVFISTKSLPQSDNKEIQYLRYIIPMDTSSYSFMHNSYDIHTETYDKEWNLIKEIYQSAYDSIPSLKREFFYNENNQIIQEKLFDNYIGPKYVHKDSLYGEYEFSVNQQYYYKDTFLIKYTFRSSIDSVIYDYYYNGNNRLHKIAKTDKELSIDTTFFYYKSDTTLSISYDSEGKEISNYKIIKDKEGRVIDMYFWQKRIPMKKRDIDYGVKYYFDERGLIVREETYKNNGEGIFNTCKFSFEYEY
jgi:hypothetical protein